MRLRKLKSKKDYLEAMTRFNEVFQAKSGTKESNEADVLAMLIKDYDDLHFAFDNSSLIDPIKKNM